MTRKISNDKYLYSLCLALFKDIGSREIQCFAEQNKNSCGESQERLNYGVEIKRCEEGMNQPGGSPRVQREEWE